MDGRLQDRIRELVSGGIVSVAAVRRSLKYFVVHDLFDEKSAPDQSNRSFYPSNKAIMNAIYRASR